MHSITAARPLAARAVERVWGCRDLPAGFARFATGAAIGEIWHEDAHGGAELLVKHLFTSERLSIQVHPDDEAARAAGYARGKDEAWLVLEAEPGAVIGLGLREAVSPDSLRAAALDGSIEALIDWRPVQAGEFIYSPAGTIHAIGAGLRVIEVQQNLDLTYRLYDYGRPRELHLDEAIAVAEPRPWRPAGGEADLGGGRRVLASGGAFVVEKWEVDGPVKLGAGAEPVLLIPLEGGLTVEARPAEPGSVWSLTGHVAVEGESGAAWLLAYPGAAIRAELRP